MTLRVLDEHKRRALEQWDAHPCGAHVASQYEFCARDYFEAIENYRYRIASPWMKEVIGFDRYAGKRLLEIGCGIGTDLLQFARGGAMVTGVDLSPRSIEIAKRRFETHGLQGEFVIGDAEQLSFPDESFDVVYSFGVLHHTPDAGRAMSEVRRVLKPGGEAIVMLYNRASLYYWGAIIIKRGLMGAQLLRFTPEEIMSRSVEYPQAGAMPLVKAYTRAEARRLFRGFSRCCIQVNQLTRGELGPLGRLFSEGMLEWLARNFGWNLIIKAIK